MPIHKIKTKGKQGYQYGNTGKKYTGPNAYAKALKQTRAIQWSKHRTMKGMKSIGKF